jgi:hypothetical protein
MMSFETMLLSFVIVDSVKRLGRHKIQMFPTIILYPLRLRMSIKFPRRRSLV